MVLFLVILGLCVLNVFNDFWICFLMVFNGCGGLMCFKCLSFVKIWYKFYITFFINLMKML